MKFLLLPFSNAEVERVFSGMNKKKTKIRNTFTLSTFLYIRCGLGRLNKFWQSFEMPENLVNNLNNSIYMVYNMNYTILI